MEWSDNSVPGTPNPSGLSPCSVYVPYSNGKFVRCLPILLDSYPLGHEFAARIRMVLISALLLVSLYDHFKLEKHHFIGRSVPSCSQILQ